MDAVGTNQRRLTDWPGYDGGPVLYPRWTTLVWRHFTPDGSKSDIYTMQLDGTGVQRLTDLDSMSWAPYFHPSGYTSFLPPTNSDFPTSSSISSTQRADMNLFALPKPMVLMDYRSFHPMEIDCAGPLIVTVKRFHNSISPPGATTLR